ncbi:U-box domain-containing protein 44-like [Juglans microcarpa x Juglans regia]|uniref:U-box domain-containing protein 44-like n=1 Tax=Juglans microcarpa x Juglans regia TaxID=2249226 RepID=UPI001B7DF1F1|nr:U-box domain-containing protein 44-like [Juglans microcarpa x Juglans regia]XP_041012637.1 U-box domain-containing protein 44-like [Juglans microcarpa x Juglans regia]XP_041012638.1 U-box domain-containing protein 44-like [Juglans microcarpa x Juglans regia]XP_041012639.1 U-box domain-containing protein 44-like [Juglans microcarpa x Juglans regia]
MNFDIGIEDISLAVLQELCNKAVKQATELVSETKEVVLNKDCFQEFLRTISDLKNLLGTLNFKKLVDATGSESTKAALETLNSQLKKACKIIKDYKSGSHIHLILKSRSMLSQMQDVAKDIASTISSFQLINLAMATRIMGNLSKMEFRSAAFATDAIALEIENLISQESKNQEHAVKLLEKIAEAVGANVNASMVQNELELLKQEKEEMETQKKQAEALQLSQLIQFLYSTEILTIPDDERIASYHQHYPIDSFICPLCKEMMTDPVAIPCGHSFERKAIREHFIRGEKKCPTCEQELLSLDLTPNLSLRNSIEEWKQRDMDLKFQAALAGLASNDHSRQNKALEDMQGLLEMPSYALKFAEEGLIPKLVEILKDNILNRVATLKCLYFLAKYCDNHRESIVTSGAVRCIVKQIYKDGTEPVAIAMLLELSERETLSEKIGSTKDCIPLLVSLIPNDNLDVSQNANKVLQKLSSNTHFVVKMAEAGHFQPFVARFNQGPQETRTLMAAALIDMQLKESSIKDLQNKQFIHNLVQMLSSSVPACKVACLRSIKKLVQYPKMVKRLLEDPVTIPHLLGLISFVRSDPHEKEEAAEILALLIGASQHLELDKYRGLQELQSKHNVSLLLQGVANCNPQTKVQFLHLLVELCHKSETAQNLIRSDMDAVGQLFSLLHSDQPAVRLWTMKLIYRISEDHPAGAPLPPSPAKETAIATLACILISSPDIEERSTAAGIISQLPGDDLIIDEILRKSDTLKAIHEVICSADEENNGTMAPARHSIYLLENALAALLRYTEPSKPELQRQVGKLELYPSLVRVLSGGSSLAKQRAAIALANLSQSTSLSPSDGTITAEQAKRFTPLVHVIMKFLPNMSWCCSTSPGNGISCSVHGVACSDRDTFCLVKADAVKPLVQTLSETESGVAEAALMALETLLTEHSTLSRATAAIVDNQGVVAILRVLEKGTLSAKAKALDLFQKILSHTQIAEPLFQRSEGILIQLLQENDLRKKVALVLKQMKILPEQSSYF